MKQKTQTPLGKSSRMHREVSSWAVSPQRDDAVWGSLQEAHLELVLNVAQSQELYLTGKELPAGPLHLVSQRPCVL